MTESPTPGLLPNRNNVTFRSVALACALMPATCLWIVQIELIWYTGHPTTISLFFHVTFILFLLSLLNLALVRLCPKRALSQAELMTVYVVLVLASTLCSHDFLQVFTPMVTFPVWHASPENRWAELILPYLPKWLIVTDESAVRGLAEGQTDPYRWSLLLAWIVPLFWWTTFILALMGALIFLNLIFRQQWTEKERLSYPVIQIPMEITGRLTALLKSRLFWYGFAITAIIDLINGFHAIKPTVPEIPIVKAFEFRDYLVERPWSSIAGTEINLYPFAIGLCFFLPTDLAFSCWFFFLFWRMEIVLTTAIGVRDLPGFPFVNEQSAGGYIGLCVLALWLSRRHLAGVVRRVLGRSGGIDDSNEPISYRKAILGLAFCVCYLIGFGAKAGASVWVLVIFFAIFFAYSIAIARMRAELGPPAHDLHAAGPGELMFDAMGTKGAGTGNMTVFSLFWWFNRAYRAHVSAHSLEGFKVAERTGMSARRLLIAMIVAIVFGLICSYWSLLHSLYVHGYAGRPAGQAFAQETWFRLNSWTRVVREPNVPAVIAIGVGLLFSLFLAAMRMKFAGFAFHPGGFASSSSWSMSKLWFCMFIGWLAKWLITRYGGARAYRRAIPFFIGLVMGEFVVGSCWSIWGAAVGKAVYHFWG